MKSIALCFLYAVLNVTGATLIKWRLKGRILNELSDWIGFLINMNVIAAFAIIFLSALVMFKALSTSNFSYIVPVATGINFILTVAIGYFIFKEQINLVSIIGFVLILGGIILLSLSNPSPTQ